MVDLSIEGGMLVLHVRGADKLWSLKSSLEIPLQHVAGIRRDPSVAHGWWHGVPANVFRCLTTPERFNATRFNSMRMPS